MRQQSAVQSRSQIRGIVKLPTSVNGIFTLVAYPADQDQGVEIEMQGTSGQRGLRHALAWLLVVLVFSPWTSALAQTTCNATNRYTLDWDSQTPKNTNLGTGSRNFTVTNAAASTVTVTMSFAGDTTHYIDSGFGQTPNISVQNVGGIGATENTLFLATDFANYASNIGTLGTNVAAVRFSFSTAVREVTFKTMDIDFAAGQFRDWIRISGTDGASTFIPTISSPYGGRNNVSNPGQTAPGVAYIGAGTVSGATIANGQISGTGISALTEDFGTVTAVFAQPVTQIELRYANGPLSTMTGTAGIQSISIHDLSFCPLPNITVAKTSAVVGDGISGSNPKAVPSADVDYTITVTNSGGSTVDINSALIADILPANMTFYNGDIDTGVAGTQNFIFGAGSSGLTLNSGNIGYSSNGGATYTYSPVAGYDAAVNAVRFSPQGTMAANSSFTVKFRARVK